MRETPESIAGKALKLRLALLLLSLLILALAIGVLGRVASAEPDGIPDHVVISEIQTDSTEGTGGSSDDYIELYNPTDEDIDLETGGYRLERWTGGGTHSIVVRFGDASDATYPGGTTIPAYGFYLVVDDDATDGSLKVKADALITRTFALGDNYAVGLGTGPMDGPTDKDTVDFVGWGTNSLYEGSSAAPNPPEARSIERKAQSTSTEETMQTGDDASRGNGYDSDDNSFDFVLRENPEPQNSSSDPEIPFGPPTVVTVTASPTNIPANGTSTATITATVQDAGGYVADTTVVTFTTSLGSFPSDPYTRTTASGVATATLRSGTTPGTATVTATSDSASGHTTIEFTPPVPVGGVVIPVNKLELLAPWMGLAALMAVAVAAVVVRLRRSA